MLYWVYGLGSRRQKSYLLKHEFWPILEYFRAPTWWGPVQSRWFPDQFNHDPLWVGISKTKKLFAKTWILANIKSFLGPPTWWLPMLNQIHWFHFKDNMIAFHCNMGLGVGISTKIKVIDKILLFTPNFMQFEKFGPALGGEPRYRCRQIFTVLSRRPTSSSMLNIGAM